ncbi:hypothetical protein WJX77_007878 [Trebouxia sp. C0004]
MDRTVVVLCKCVLLTWFRSYSRVADAKLATFTALTKAIWAAEFVHTLDLHQLDDSALEHSNNSRTSTHTTPSPLGNLSSFVLPQSRQLQHALRPGSAQLLQQRRRPPTASCGAIQAIKQAEATAAPAAPADDESANNDQKNAGSDTAPLVRTQAASSHASVAAMFGRELSN